jgi:hypothetical protein
MCAEWREVTVFEGADGGEITKFKKQRWNRWRDTRKGVVTPHAGRPRQVSWSWYQDRWRDRILDKLDDRVGNLRITQDPRDVPVNIVNEGKPAVASYLYAVHAWSYQEINDMLELTGGTIRQYVVAVANDNR